MKKINSINSKWKFLLAMTAIYIVIGFFNYSLFIEAFGVLKELILKIIPILFLVFIFIFISNLFLTREFIKKNFSKGKNFKRWVFLIGAGILSSGPIYVWYPFLKEAKEKGIDEEGIAIFLANRAIKIPLLPMMIYYFGGLFTLIIIFYMVLFSLINGFLVGKLNK